MKTAISWSLVLAGSRVQHSAAAAAQALRCSPCPLSSALSISMAMIFDAQLPQAVLFKKVAESMKDLCKEVGRVPRVLCSF